MKDFGLDEEDCRLWVSCEARRQTNIHKNIIDNDNDNSVYNGSNDNNDNSIYNDNNRRQGFNFIAKKYQKVKPIYNRTYIYFL